MGEKRAAVVHITLGEWTTILSLVFGGCCSNVFTLEKMVKANSESGNIVTFCQFLLVAAEGYVNHFDIKNKPFFIKQNKVPLRKWVLSIIMFFLVSVLNNWVWAFNISVPVHIIFRSSSTAVTMAIGYSFGKRYNTLQVVSSIILSVGVMIATLSTTNTDASASAIFSAGDQTRFYIGLSILFVAAIIYGFMGLYNENIYKQYGNQWKENLFYTHFFSLPLFLGIAPKLVREFQIIWNHPDIFVVPIMTKEVAVPKQIVYLLMNCFTQYLCIRGVNMLAGNTSALTVSVILLVRKFTSLFISMALFGNRLTSLGSVGASLVFSGAFLYSYASSSKKPISKTDKDK